MTFSQTSENRGARVVARTQEMEAAAYYQLIMAATLPALAILLAAAIMMTKLLMV